MAVLLIYFLFKFPCLVELVCFLTISCAMSSFFFVFVILKCPIVPPFRIITVSSYIVRKCELADLMVAEMKSDRRTPGYFAFHLTHALGFFFLVGNESAKRLVTFY